MRKKSPPGHGHELFGELIILPQLPYLRRVVVLQKQFSVLGSAFRFRFLYANNNANEIKILHLSSNETIHKIGPGEDELQQTESRRIEWMGQRLWDNEANSLLLAYSSDVDSPDMIAKVISFEKSVSPIQVIPTFIVVSQDTACGCQKSMGHPEGGKSHVRRTTFQDKNYNRGIGHHAHVLKRLCLARGGRVAECES